MAESKERLPAEESSEMLCKAYYGKYYPALKAAQAALERAAKILRTTEPAEQELMPIVYYCSRIKTPESMIAKLKGRGLATDAASAMKNVYDAVGLRIVCAFEGDVLRIVSLLLKAEEWEVIEKKDYLAFPKPSGYRSYHLRVRMKKQELYAEIQVRTIAMDFWATLEHQLKYKKKLAHEELITSELKRCADEIASVDVTMQAMREILKEISRF